MGDGGVIGWIIGIVIVAAVLGKLVAPWLAIGLIVFALLVRSL